MNDGFFLAIILLAIATAAAIVASAAAISPDARAVVRSAEKAALSGISYVTGGIGEGQMDAIQSVRDKYNLRVTFARERAGEYLSDIHVRIEDVHGKCLVDVVAPGPLFYARLPDGEYRVSSSFGGQEKTLQIIIVKGHPHEVVFYFAPTS